MISYKQLKKRSKSKKIKRSRIKQFCKVLLVASCSFAPFNESFAQTGNTLYGTGAGTSILTADSIVAFGVNAGGGVTAGGRHIFIGTNAGYHLNHNPFATLGPTSPGAQGGSVHIGYYAGYHTTTGNENIFIGEQSGYRNTSGSDNTFIGSMTGLHNLTGGRNVFIGSKAGFSNTTSHQNTFIGEEAGRDNTTGQYNTFLGHYSGALNTTGYRNTFIGHDAGSDNKTGQHNTALGDSSLLDNGSGRYNTALGAGTGANTESASYNTFVGAYAGWDNNRNNSPITSKRNTYLGAFASYKNREGSDNVGIGAFADFVYQSSFSYAANSNINNNVFIGNATSVTANGVTIIGNRTSASGTNGIAIGRESSVTAANAIAIGYQTSAINANEIVLGNATHTTIGGSVNWTATSDGRFKTDIQENVIGLDLINALRPVTYFFDSKKVIQHTGNEVPNDLLCAIEAKDTIRYTGFIAQEVEQAAQNINFNFSGVDKRVQVSDTLSAKGRQAGSKVSDTYGLRYAEFVVPLVKATQELSQKVEALKQENAAQKELLSKYEAALENALLHLEAMESDK